MARHRMSLALAIVTLGSLAAGLCLIAVAIALPRRRSHHRSKVLGSAVPLLMVAGVLSIFSIGILVLLLAVATGLAAWRFSTDQPQTGP